MTTTLAKQQTQSTAACSGTDPRPFSLAEGESVHSGEPPSRAWELARTYCLGCPLRKSCGEQADYQLDPGLWGGKWRYRNTSNGASSYNVVDLLGGGHS